MMGNFHDGNLVENLGNDFKGEGWTEPTDEQIDSLKNLIDVLDSRYGIDQVGGHRDFTVDGGDSVCPGNVAYPILEEEGIIDLD